MKIIGHIFTDFDEKFGAPRQSGLVDGLTGRIVFEPEYRRRDAFLGLEGYSHLWVLWEFSECVREKWKPVVRPPRLGGNTRMGVFATRSPFRPNPIGLSSVRLEGIAWEDKDGPVLKVSGVDMMNKTPIYDIKPYLAYTDSHPDALGGFTDGIKDYRLQVAIPKELEERIPERLRKTLRGVLSEDPRPAYIDDPDRVFGVCFSGMNVRFTVKENVLTVRGVEL